jgi:hypothetical protein
VFNELMTRLFGGASLALLLLSGLSTSARALADPPQNNSYCSILLNCTNFNCASGPPCGSNACKTINEVAWGCFCADYTAGEDKCGCTTD